jgi:ABC-type multidrug transport system fused ATPase/permease subunit
MAKRGESQDTTGKIDKNDLPKAKLTLKNLKKSLRLFTYLGRHKWKFILGLFFLAASAGVGLIFPMQAGKLLGYLGESNLSPDEMKTELYKVGFVLAGILVAQSAFSFGRVYLFAQVTENVLKGLRTDTFKRLVQMPMSFFSKNQVSELNSRMATDINVSSHAAV